MASLSNDKGVLRRILFKHADGSRKAIRLGRTSASNAATILSHVKHLEACQFDRSAPPPRTAEWLNDISDTLRKRLVAVGLASPKVADPGEGLTLAQLIETFKDQSKWRNQKPKTTKNYRLFFEHITAAIGGATLVARVTESAADDLIGFLMEAKPRGRGLARGTAHRTCGAAVTLFKFALRSRLIGRNPFEGIACSDIPAGSKAFVDAAVCRRVVDALPDSEMRLLFALSRWGGLRVPSEPRELRWGDIDRERNRITVTSPKTAHHHGHEQRTIPLFPELVRYIDERYADAEPGEFVLPIMRLHADSMYSSRLAVVLKRLGIEPWPRIFHSLRSTRQTELEELYPSHVVCAWLGNSEAVARRNYLQVTDEHYRKAAQNATQHSPESRLMTAKP